MSVGDRYLRLHERIGAVIGYLVIIALAIPVTIEAAGVAQLIVALIALHLAAATGTRLGRAWGQRRTTALVGSAPGHLPAEVLATAAERSDPQELVRALARLPDAPRARWLAIAGDLPHRCGTTVRSEVERQGAVTGEQGVRELDSLAARIAWPADRRATRLLALAPTAIWLAITVIAIAGWPAFGERLVFSLATVFCVIGLAAIAVSAIRDERRGFLDATTPAPLDW